MNKIVQFQDADGNNVFPVGFMAGFPVIDTSNVLANVPYSKGEKTYTATVDCYVACTMEYIYTANLSRYKLDGNPLSIDKDTDNVYTGIYLKAGQTLTIYGGSARSSGYIVFGLKY